MPPPSALACTSAVELAAEPALEKTAGYAIADLDANDTGADRNHLARAVGQRDDVFLHRHAIGAAHDAEIAEIKRTGFDLHQHLTIGRLGIRTFDLHQGVDTGAAFGQLIGTHENLVICSYCFLLGDAGLPRRGRCGRGCGAPGFRALFGWPRGLPGPPLPAPPLPRRFCGRPLFGCPPGR